MSGDPFEWIKAITDNKTDIIAESDDPSRTEKEYNSYIVNKGLSYFNDTALYANEMNRYHQLDSKLQFDYLLNSIRPRRRYAKWVKKVSEDDLEAVKDYFKYNTQKARTALSILSDDQLKIIKEKLQQGVV